MEQRDEKNLGAENLQRIAQQVNGIAEKIVALAQGGVAAARQVLESEAFREALQAALQEIQTDQARPLAALQKLPPTWKAHTGRIAIRWATSSR